MRIENALDTLRHLAEGIDPTTLDEIPRGEVVNRPDVVRALYTVLIEFDRREPNASYRDLDPMKESESDLSTSSGASTSIDPIITVEQVEVEVPNNSAARSSRLQLSSLTDVDKRTVRVMRIFSWSVTLNRNVKQVCNFCRAKVPDGVFVFYKVSIDGPRTHCCRRCATLQAKGYDLSLIGEANDFYD